ncbi:MAG: class F sortase [Micrococcus sp.]|nr:class F sortase [Micrococcus sp.]
MPVVTATLAPAAAASERPAPVRVEYASIGAELPVVPTGVADGGQMQIPEDAATAGWYRFGPAPADGEGNTVIAAHAGSAQTPVGPLYGLREAQPGEVVRVEDAAGQQHAYRVTEVHQLGKDGLDFTPYFTRSGPERLVLVTCGGQWLPERQSYADNIIVVAEAVD